MTASQKLVLIDGHSLAYRAYHALPPTMATTKGELTNAVYGFITTLLKILKDEQPEYLAVAFDVGRTFRDDLFREYKGTRLAMPADLHYQIERIRDLVRAFSIPVLELEGYEADDVLGTVARQAEEHTVETLIYTGDTDAFQLIGPLVKVAVSRRQFGDLAVYDEAAVKERYGLSPNQLADYRGLKGDTSDNIPGVPGIGEKTAADLLQRFQHLEGIYEHLDEISAKRAREALAAHREQAFLSRKLATIVRDVPLTFEWRSYRLSDYDPEEVKRICRELEFRSLIDRLPVLAHPEPSTLSLSKGVEGLPEPTVAYEIVQDDEALRRLAKRLQKAKAIAVDTETSSENALTADLVGISLSTRAGQATYLPVGHRAAPQAELLPVEQPSDDYRCLSLEAVRRHLGPILADAGIPKIGHNIKFDALALAAHGLPLEGISFDTMLAAFLLDPGSRQLGLKTLGFNRLGREMTEITALIGKGKDQITMAQVPISKAAPYACADADVTFSLAEPLAEELKEKQAWPLFSEIEMPLVPVLIAMEQAGVMLDVGYLASMKVELDKRLSEIETTIYQLVGHPFNINSTQQLSKVLFEELKLDTTGVGKTSAGGYSTAVGVLEQLQGAHAVVDVILEHRQLDKLQSTYVEALPAMISPADKRLHTSYNQAGAVTGRVSSSEPNLQNIPIRTELGRRVRQAFVAPPGMKLVAADYSQVELRILAHLSQDEGLLQ
ncbi:MAG: DNA polymerase I, partial [Chloroflexi bacterium]|nr:DNA polymerase I [Chloroflexota bacterium]